MSGAVRLVLLLLLGATLSAQAPAVRMKFYVTGGRTEDARGYRDDCTVPPLVGYGADRLDALTRTGLTVWTEAEWLHAKAISADMCQRAPIVVGPEASDQALVCMTNSSGDQSCAELGYVRLAILQHRTERRR